MRRFIAVLGAAILVSACSTIHVSPDGTISGRAFGQSSITAHVTPEGSVATADGGAISEAFAAGIFGKLVTSARDAFLAFFGRGQTAPPVINILPAPTTPTDAEVDDFISSGTAREV
jgi:hypothetical protein